MLSISIADFKLSPPSHQYVDVIVDFKLVYFDHQYVDVIVDFKLVSFDHQYVDVLLISVDVTLMFYRLVVHTGYGGACDITYLFDGAYFAVISCFFSFLQVLL